MAASDTQVAMEPRLCPEEFVQVNFGTFNGAATSNGGTTVTNGANQALPFMTDREIKVDSVIGTMLTKPGAALTMRLAYATNGQTMAQAVTASQYITASYDLNTATDDTKFALTVDRLKNVIPAFSRLFLVFGASANTAMRSLQLQARLTTKNS